MAIDRGYFMRCKELELSDKIKLKYDVYDIVNEYEGAIDENTINRVKDSYFRLIYYSKAEKGMFYSWEKEIVELLDKAGIEFTVYGTVTTSSGYMTVSKKEVDISDIDYFYGRY